MNRSIFRADRESRGLRASRSSRLAVESLEGRQLLSSLDSPHVKPFNNPVYAITATLPPTSDPGGSGDVFQSRVSVTGKAPASSTIWLAQGPRGYFINVAQADGSGQYSFTTALPKGQTELRLFAKNGLNQYSVVTKLEVNRGNPILAWDALALSAIKKEGLTAPEAARGLAILHLAQYDAVASVQFPKDAYQVHVVAPKGASAEAAAANAARTVLATLFPKEADSFTQAMNEYIAGAPKSAATRDGFAVGEQVGQATLANRANEVDPTFQPIAPSNVPGHWRPTPPGFSPAVDAAWGGVKPFALDGGSQFRPDAPPTPGSAAYDLALGEVASLGRINSSTRTGDQTSAARFWTDGPGTATNPGHWNEIARTQALRRKGSLAQDARLFAMLDVAMADAGIAAFDAKAAFTTWRPVSAIQQTDPTWTPLETTPANPSYVSDHAAFGTAAADVLTSVFGSRVAFTDTVDATAGNTRTFTSFAAAALEDGQSRVWAGQNFSYDIQQGQALGDKVGGFVVTRFPRSK